MSLHVRKGVATVAASIFILVCLAGSVLAQQAGHAVVDQDQWRVLAKDKVTVVASESLRNPGSIVSSNEKPRNKALEWIAGQDLEPGRNLVNGELIYVGLGSAVVNAAATDPDFLESRYLAFQRAELSAKAKIALYLGVDLTSERSSSEKSLNPGELAALRKLVETDPRLEGDIKGMGLADKVFGLLNKTVRLADARLDQALEDSGADTGADKARARDLAAMQEAEKARLARLRTVSASSAKAAACAFATVQGAQTVQSVEGTYHGGYQMVVVVMWSRNMQTLVNIMLDNRVPSSLKKTPRARVTRQLPGTDGELVCLTGVRSYVDHDGYPVLLSFGQAGVDDTGARLDKAFEQAEIKAQLRAQAAMRNFMGEQVAFAADEELVEALARFAKASATGQSDVEYRLVKAFQSKVLAKAGKARIVGIHELNSYELKHPLIGRDLVLSVWSWSPRSKAMSKELKKAMEQPGRYKVDTWQTKTAGSADAQGGEQGRGDIRQGTLSSGGGENKDAW